MYPPSTTVTCPQCQTPFAAQIEQIFDVGRDPAAKARFLRGRFNVITCPRCRFQSMVATPIVYHDPAKELLMTFVPMELGLPQAEQERLREDLTVSKEETRSAREETRVSKGETVDAQWAGFKAEVVLSVCEKGNRKRMETCREEVGASLSSTRAARFKQCVGSRQAQPRLVRVDDKEKNPELPRWSEWLNEESKFTEKKWYVVFCDPTLPESNMQDPEDEEL